MVRSAGLSARLTRILVAAGAPAVPQPIVDQLEEGGRLVIPKACGSPGTVAHNKERRKNHQGINGRLPFFCP